jgi:hypothetical protein
MSKPKKRRRSRAKPGGLPKGAYRVPGGGIALPPLTSTLPNGRRITVTGVLREEPDLRLLAKAFVALAIELAEQERKDH